MSVPCTQASLSLEVAGTNQRDAAANRDIAANVRCRTALLHAINSSQHLTPACLIASGSQMHGL